MNDAARATLYLSVGFFAFGVTLPYLPLWLESVRGLNGAEIGFTVFGAALGRIVTGPLVGAWAENRTGRNVAIRMSFSVIVAYVLLYFAPNPLALIATGFIALSIVSSMMPVGEAMLLLAQGRMTFGQGRAIGSAGFVGGVFLGGWLKDIIGAEAIVPTILVIYVLGLSSAFLAPTAPLGDLSGGMSFSDRLKKGMKLYQRPTLLFLLLSTGPLQASHAFYYGFSAAIWQSQGVSGAMTSALWSVGVVIEIILLSTAGFWSRFITPQHFILFGAIGSVVRWTGLSMSPELPAAFFLQTLHALSFAAVYLGAVQIIDRDVAREDKTAAMSLQAALTSGAFTGVAGLIAGPVYDALHVRGYLVMTATAVVGLVFALLLMWRIAVRPKRESPPLIGS